MISQIVGTTKIEVEYERPSVRKRKIFGELVPWNKVWRTGAGYCTKIGFDNTVEIKGQKIPAGKYSLFTIPEKEKWMVILNHDITLYGSYDYHHEKDVARFIVFPQKSSRFYEALTIDIDIIPNNARVYISWANTQIAFDIITDTDTQVYEHIQNELSFGNTSESDDYAGAADFYLYKKENLMEALSLADKAINLDTYNGWARRVKIEILEALKLDDKASLEIDKAIEMTKSRIFENESERKNEIDYWMSFSSRINAKQD
jgi:tetratricopeptide (TPR) repeat protein